MRNSFLFTLFFTFAAMLMAQDSNKVRMSFYAEHTNSFGRLYSFAGGACGNIPLGKGLVSVRMQHSLGINGDGSWYIQTNILTAGAVMFVAANPKEIKIGIFGILSLLAPNGVTLWVHRGEGSQHGLAMLPLNYTYFKLKEHYEISAWTPEFAYHLSIFPKKGRGFYAGFGYSPLVLMGSKVLRPEGFSDKGLFSFRLGIER